MPLLLDQPEPWASPARRVAAYGGGTIFADLNSPEALDFLRGGSETSSGGVVTIERALRNTAVFRAVNLISNAIGMLPLQLLHEDSKEKAAEHPLYRLLHRKPNAWQSAYQFRTQMQARALLNKRGAFARIIRTRNLRTRTQDVTALHPLDPARVEPFQQADTSVAYKYQPPNGAQTILAPEEVLHVSGLTLDGINGLSMVDQAREAIALAQRMELAAARLFKDGVLAGSAMKMPAGKPLSQEAYERLVASIEAKSGAENAGKNLLLEEGLDL